MSAYDFEQVSMTSGRPPLDHRRGNWLEHLAIGVSTVQFPDVSGSKKRCVGQA